MGNLNMAAQVREQDKNFIVRVTPSANFDPAGEAGDFFVRFVIHAFLLSLRRANGHLPLFEPVFEYALCVDF